MIQNQMKQYEWGWSSCNREVEIKGNASGKYYIVVGGPLNIIVLIGHDGIIEVVSSVCENGVLNLLYGDRQY